MASAQTPIYLDYAATTPADPRVIELMVRHLGTDGTFANPASRSHMLGWLAEQAVEGARRQVADLIRADPREIVWTSGATEADNLALTGFMRAQRKAPSGHGRCHLVTSSIEHKAIIDTALALEEEGFEVTFLKPGTDGRISPEMLRRAIRPDTALVSLMAVNNELGSCNDLATLGEIAHEHGALFHVDGAQAAGKIELNVEHLPIDMLSLSGHKIYGPKGIGALYVRRGTSIEALIHGGGHERGMRSGTLATHQIVGMGKAFELAEQEMLQDNQHLARLRTRLLDNLKALPGFHLNVPEGHGVANILSVSFDHVDGQALLMGLKDIAISNGSACNSASVAPSYVLSEIGVPEPRALATLRISMGRFTTEEEIDRAVAVISSILDSVRAHAIAQE